MQEQKKTPEPAANDRIEQRKKMMERRCDNCNHLLMNHKITAGVVEIKCPKCGHMNWVKGESLEHK